jgi:hypothetical protein
MSKNNLMEAAANLLAKKAMPPEKAEGSDYVELGGNPQDVETNKPGQDPYAHYKIDATKAAKNAEAPKTKPSDASAEMAHKTLSKEETEAENEKLFKEDIEALLAGDETISEDFKNKATAIFEARVLDRVSQIQEALEEEYATVLENVVAELHKDLSEKVDDYLNYVVEQWMSENEIAIESGLRAELSEEFIAGLRNLFAEHYIDVPAEKVDLVDELSERVLALEERLNEEMEQNIQFKKALVESHKNEIVHAVCEGLTATQVEKMKTLAESVEFSTADEYAEKLEAIRENYFPTGVKKADEAQLHEAVEIDESVKSNDPFISAVASAISKTKL